MKSEKVSIIIPVYNAEKNISKCLNSIINQTYNNLEIICINDGSKDDSKNILLNYCHRDKRLKLIDKDNSGVSDTRNIGINESTGKYIMFIDADDYIALDYIEKMLENMQEHNCDLIVSGYTELKNNKEVERTIYINEKSNCFDVTYPKEIYNMFSSYEYNPCWKQLIRKSILIDNDIRFDKKIKYGEDMLFSFYCYTNSSKTMYLKNFGYYYYINEDSVMNKKDFESLNKYYSDNSLTTSLILSNNTFSEREVQALYFKTLKVFNGISSSFVINSCNYNEFKGYVLKARNDYNDLFKKCDIIKFGTIKEKISLLLLKYKMIKIYYLLKK